MPDAAIWVWICDDCTARQCGLCIEANETTTPGPGCDCEHEDWDEEAAMPAIPQPQHRRRWLTTCSCRKRFWGSSRWAGRGYEAYKQHVKDGCRGQG